MVFMQARNLIMTVHESSQVVDNQGVLWRVRRHALFREFSAVGLLFYKINKKLSFAMDLYRIIGSKYVIKKFHKFVFCSNFVGKKGNHS